MIGIVKSLRWHSRLGCVEKRTNRAHGLQISTGDISDQIDRAPDRYVEEFTSWKVSGVVEQQFSILKIMTTLSTKL